VTDDDERWWCTQQEAARRLGVTEHMIRSMILRGQLHPVRVGGRKLLRWAEVDAVRDEWAKAGDR